MGLCRTFVHDVAKDIGQMVLDDCECMRGPAWSVALLGVDAGFACKQVDDPLDIH